jgi:WD40 repeat protein
VGTFTAKQCPSQVYQALPFADCNRRTVHFCVQAHPGGVLSLEFQRPGHLLATCGADKTVQTWDLNTNQHVTTYNVSHRQCCPVASHQTALPDPAGVTTSPAHV